MAASLRECFEAMHSAAPSPTVCLHRGFWDRGADQAWDLEPGDVAGVPSCR
jgi:hypothetical protein